MNEYFRRSEFACNCGCGMSTVDAELLQILTDVRVHFNSPVIINSGNRCRVWNRAQGGNQASFHMRSRAADFVVTGVDATQVQDYLLDKYPGQYGIGSYSTFTHIDSRGYRARWDG